MPEHVVAVRDAAGRHGLILVIAVSTSEVNLARYLERVLDKQACLPRPYRRTGDGGKHCKFSIAPKTPRGALAALAFRQGTATGEYDVLLMEDVNGASLQEELPGPQDGEGKERMNIVGDGNNITQEWQQKSSSA